MKTQWIGTSVPPLYSIFLQQQWCDRGIVNLHYNNVFVLKLIIIFVENPRIIN
jgi:hypothetical protein